MDTFYFIFLLNYFGAAAAAKSLQSCLTLCDPIDGSPPGSPIPGLLQARTLEWVAISFSSAWTSNNVLFKSGKNGHLVLFLTFEERLLHFYCWLWCYWAVLVAQTVKNLLAMWETWVLSLVWEDPLEKGMATHSSILGRRTLWTEELQSVGSKESDAAEWLWERTMVLAADSRIWPLLCLGTFLLFLICWAFLS